MCQTTDELAAALKALAEADPDFMAELIGSVVKANLHIQEQSRDFYASRDSWVNPKLSWGSSPRAADDFSFA